MNCASSMQGPVRTRPPDCNGGAFGAALRGRTLIHICCAVLPLCSLAGADETVQEKPSAPKPFFRAREHQTEYAGPGRELPPPADVDEVLIGYFGPNDPADLHGGDIWRAARMAVEEANAAGGYRGKPFRLLPAWSKNPWGSGVAQLARMVYQDRVWAIIGGVDGPSTHLAEQVVAKARLTLISPAAGDKTVNLVNVPWMFSCLPGDHLQAPVLGGEIEARMGRRPWLIVSTDDHDARLFAVELSRWLAKRRMAPRYRFTCKQAATDVAELAGRVVQSKVDAVVLVAGAADSARLLSAIRGRGFEGTVFGGPAMGRGTFLRQAGAAAEGAIFPLLYQPGDGSREFAATFRSRFGRLPDYAAAHGYDAVRLLIAAIHKAGLNRARIRDAVAGLSPWAGTTGTIQWDRLGANTRAVRPGTIRNGRPVAAVATAEVRRMRTAHRELLDVFHPGFGGQWPP